jgi:hypothetical protein
MTDDADAAMLAGRRERVDRALETVENMSLSSHHYLEGFVVLVATAIAFRHMRLLFAALMPRSYENPDQEFHRTLASIHLLTPSTTRALRGRTSTQ